MLNFINNKTFSLKFVLLTCLISTIFGINIAKSDLTPFESLVLSLKQGPNSAGVKIAQTYHSTDDMVTNLDRAITQIHLAENKITKMTQKNKNYLEDTDKSLNQAERTLKALRKELRIASKILKSDVETIILENPQL